MAANTQLGGKVIKEYLKKFPKTPTLTLAKKIYKENKELFTKIETVRSSINYYRGKLGAKKKAT